MNLTQIAKRAELAAIKHHPLPAPKPRIPEFVVYEIPLGPARCWARARLVLPFDLSQAEADRLNAVLQSLVMAPAEQLLRREQ